MIRDQDSPKPRLDKKTAAILARALSEMPLPRDNPTPEYVDGFEEFRRLAVGMLRAVGGLD